jgi:hypothetical protein
MKKETAINSLSTRTPPHKIISLKGREKSYKRKRSAAYARVFN